MGISNKKNSLIVISIALLIVFLFAIDYKKVNFTYVGEVKITPPVNYYRGDTIVWIIKKGENLKKYLESSLFHGVKISNLSGEAKAQPYPETDHYKLEWEKEIHIDPEEKYYIGVGCKIEKMTYFYHSRLYYTRSTIPCFRAYKVQLTPAPGVLTIYKGDALLASI